MDPSGRPIGIFDSGIGGLTVANAIKKLLPNESIVYFGDTAHLPYGDKSADALRYFSLRISKFLIDQKCKAIVVACNSASSTSFDTLTDFFQKEVLFLNVVDPLVQATLEKDYKNVGVIATKATIRSNAYQRKLNASDSLLEVNQLATPLLVHMIEEGYHNNEISHAILDNYLKLDQFSEIEALLLACTHYPLIKSEIQAYFKNKVDILDPNESLAQRLKITLEANGLLNESPNKEQDRFYVSDFTDSFLETTKLFYGQQVELKEIDIWK